MVAGHLTAWDVSENDEGSPSDLHRSRSVAAVVAASRVELLEDWPPLGRLPAGRRLGLATPELAPLVPVPVLVPIKGSSQRAQVQRTRATFSFMTRATSKCGV